MRQFIVLTKVSFAALSGSLAGKASKIEATCAREAGAVAREEFNAETQRRRGVARSATLRCHHNAYDWSADSLIRMSA